MSKNTAVEWLVTELRNRIAEGTLDAIAISKLKMQAKAMEREQIENAWHAGVSDSDIAMSYYNDRYRATSEKYYNKHTKEVSNE